MTIQLVSTVPEIDYYGDDPVIWGISGFVSEHTEAYAAALGVSLTKMLLNNIEPSPRATRLADLLKSCSPYERCNSGACPICMRARQRWLVREGIPLLCKYGRCNVGELAGRFQAVHIEPVLANGPGSKKITGNIEEARDELLHILINAGFEFCIGGLHALFTQTRIGKNGFSPIHRRVGASFLLGRDEFRRYEVSLRAAFSKLVGMSHRITTCPFDGNPRFFEQAIRYVPLPRTSDETPEGITNSRLKSSIAADHARLACHLHKVCPSGQILIVTESDWDDLGRLYL